MQVFVTHGGLLSLMEAIYYQTVVVGIPFANDQGRHVLQRQRRNFSKIKFTSNFSFCKINLSI
jgi:hypothetical protein